MNKLAALRQTGLVLLERPLCGTPLLLLTTAATALHLAWPAHPSQIQPDQSPDRPDADGSQRWRPGCCQAPTLLSGCKTWLDSKNWVNIQQDGKVWVIKHIKINAVFWRLEQLI